MSQRTPLYVVCSPRPRVGKTLIARLLVEFFHADLRSVVAFDLNPHDPALADYLPGWTEIADVTESQGQIALFDRLIIDDGMPKVVDLGIEGFRAFFTVMHDVDFVDEARRRGIEPVILFIVDPDRMCERAYADLRERHPGVALVPVFNEAVTRGYDYRERFPPAGPGRLALTIPQLSPVLKGVIDKQTFSFASFIKSEADAHSEIYGWVKRIFREFRELELRLLLDKLRLEMPRGA